jgi:hypothetical protein
VNWHKFDHLRGKVILQIGAEKRNIPDAVPPEARGVGSLLVDDAAIFAFNAASLSFSFLLFLRPVRGILVLAENRFCTADSVSRVRKVDRDRAKASGGGALGGKILSWHETPHRVNSSLWRLLLKRTSRELCKATAGDRARQPLQHVRVRLGTTNAGGRFFWWHKQASSLQARLGDVQLLARVILLCSALFDFSSRGPRPPTPAQRRLAHRPKNTAGAGTGHPGPPWPSPCHP